MQVDISRQILKWKALDRWENEGGTISDERIELVNIGSSDSVFAESNSRTHPGVGRQFYTDGKQEGDHMTQRHRCYDGVTLYVGKMMAFKI